MNIIGTYSRPSICSCGFPILRTEVPMGTRYVCIDLKIPGFTVTCGGCAKSFPVTCVFARKEDCPSDEGGYLPVDLLDFDPPLAQSFNGDDV